MFKSEQDANVYGKECCEFIAKVWTSTTEWDAEFLGEKFSDDVIITWQGKASNGMAEVLKNWKPVQKAIVSYKSLGYDVDTFAENMVSFTEYMSFKTFDDQEKFMKWQCTVVVDESGKIAKGTWTATPKYANVFDGTLGAYMQSVQ